MLIQVLPSEKYQDRLTKLVTYNAGMVPIKRIVTGGTKPFKVLYINLPHLYLPLIERYRSVTAQGLETIRNAFRSDGFVTMGNHFMVRKLKSDEVQLKDGEPEYECIDGNHRLFYLKNEYDSEVVVCFDLVKVRKTCQRKIIYINTISRMMQQPSI